MSEIWLTTQETARLLGISSRAVRLRLDEFVTKEVAGKGGRGGKKVQVLFSSLPASAQAKYLEQLDDENSEISQAWDCLGEKQRDQVLKRLGIIQEIYNALKKVGHGGRKSVIENIGFEHRVNTVTLYRWLKWFSDGKVDKDTGELITGPLALASSYGRTRGQFTAISGELEKFIQSAWWKKNRPSKALVFEQLKMFCDENGFTCPSIAAVRRYISSLPANMNILYRYGPKAYKQRFEPVVERTLSSLSVNEIWVGDHRQHDVFLYTSQSRKQAKRVWMTAWWDLASAKLVGYCLSFQPSSRTIALALRNGILTHGMPDMVYMDNGKDYQSKQFSGRIRRHGKIPMDSDTRGLLAILEIEQINALPYNARSKSIERWFKTWSERFDRRLPGWCGRDNKERPEKLQQELDAGELLLLVDFKQMVEEFRAELDGKVWGERKKTPATFYDGFKPRMVDEKVLDLLLMEKKSLKVGTRGIEAFPNLFYNSVGLMERVMVGQNVTVRYDPDNLDTIVVWDKDGKLIGRVPQTMKGGQAGKVEDMEAYREVKKFRKAQKKQIQELAPVGQFWQDDFEKALAKVKEMRERKDKDLSKPDLQRMTEPATVRFFPDEQHTAGEVADAEQMPEVEQKAKIVSIFGKAVGDDFGDVEDEYNPLFED